MMNSLLGKAPALFVLEAAILTLWLNQQHFSFLYCIGASFIIIVLELAVVEERWTKNKMALSALILTASLVVSAKLVYNLNKNDVLPSVVTGSFTVINRRAWGDNSLLTVKDDQGRRWITAARGDLAAAQEGDRYSFTSTVRTLKAESRRSAFSPKKFWRARGILGELRDVRSLSSLPSFFSVYTVRRYLRARIRSLPSASRALTSAVLLGDRETNISEDFRRWGISHFLAVSGWHVSFTVILAVIVAGKRRAGLLTASCFLWLYCLISGGAASAIRAAVMLQLALLGLFCGMGTAALNAVGLAGVFMLLWEPWVFYDLGWQMSVQAAALAIVLQRFKSVTLLLLSSAFMWVIMSPQTAPMAGGIYFSSLPINMMATSLFSFILVFMIVLSVFGLLCPFLIPIFTQMGEQIFKLWAVAADQWCVWLPQALPVGMFPAWMCGGLFFLLLGLSLRIKTWRALAFSFLGCVLFNVFV